MIVIFQLIPDNTKVYRIPKDDRLFAINGFIGNVSDVSAEQEALINELGERLAKETPILSDVSNGQQRAVAEADEDIIITGFYL